MWPEPVERIAAFLRASGASGSLEELPADAETAPGPALQAEGFECDGRVLVALVPDDRRADRNKVAAAARCRAIRLAAVGEFPFPGALVFLDRTLLTAETVWLQVGAAGFVLGLPPTDLARLTRAETADLLLEA